MLGGDFLVVMVEVEVVVECVVKLVLWCLNGREEFL